MQDLRPKIEVAFKTKDLHADDNKTHQKEHISKQLRMF